MGDEMSNARGGSIPALKQQSATLLRSDSYRSRCSLHGHNVVKLLTMLIKI